MSWDTAANVATTVGTLVALVGVLGSLWLSLRSERLTRRGQELERRQADAAAGRSEAAARLTEEYTRRVVEALETMATAPAGGVSPAHAAHVRWTLVHHAGDTYRLENTGNLTASNVRINAHESMVADLPEPQDLGPGEAVTFLAVRTFGTSDSTISVTWCTETGEDQVWRYPLPAKLR